MDGSTIPIPSLVRALLRYGVLRPYEDIKLDSTLYMRRWWLHGDEKRREAKQITAGVHHIVHEDSDRDMHTHPCSFISIVLWGWYRERLPRSQHQSYLLDSTKTIERVRRPGSVAMRRDVDRHMITEVSPNGALTLVIWLKKTGSWGFATKDGFVNWRHYKRGQS